MSERWLPKSYQPAMVEHLLANPEAFLFATMGTGKTVATLTAVSELILSGASKGCLIVAPIRVISITWANQVARWNHTRWLRIANMRDPDNWPLWENGGADIYLINPEKLATIERTVKRKVHRTPGFVDRFIKGRKSLPVDIFVLDESSLAKSPSGKRFNALRPHLHTPHFKRRWGLTGTPAPNSYMDLFSQVRLIDNGVRLGRSIHLYKQTYFDSDYMGWTFEIKPGAKERIDAKLADIALVVDDPDQPPMRVVDVEVALPKDAAKAYKTLEKDMLLKLETGDVEALSAAALVTKLLQACAGCIYGTESEVHVVHDAKLKALAKIRKDHPKEPLLVLTSFIHERERLLEAFPEARQFHEKDMALWQAGKIPMWVGDARSLCHGIDGLQDAGRILVWMTGTYSNEVYQQANARLARTGQRHETIVYRVLARGTIDDAVVEVLREKADQQAGLMAAVHALQALRKSG